MGWRKWTILPVDGDLARCCAAHWQGPIIREASLEVCFKVDAAASSESLAGRQCTLNSRRLGRLSPGQSGPRMWSSESTLR